MCQAVYHGKVVSVVLCYRISPHARGRQSLMDQVGEPVSEALWSVHSNIMQCLGELEGAKIPGPQYFAASALRGALGNGMQACEPG